MKTWWRTGQSYFLPLCLYSLCASPLVLLCFAWFLFASLVLPVCLVFLCCSSCSWFSSFLFSLCVVCSSVFFLFLCCFILARACSQLLEFWRRFYSPFPLFYSAFSLLVIMVPYVVRPPVLSVCSQSPSLPLFAFAPLFFSVFSLFFSLSVSVLSVHFSLAFYKARESKWSR